MQLGFGVVHCCGGGSGRGSDDAGGDAECDEDALDVSCGSLASPCLVTVTGQQVDDAPRCW
jgi:hypothetical protein